MPVSKSLALGAAVALLSFGPRANADVIGLEDPCPPGSSPRNAHVGTWCIPAECSADDDCEAQYGQPHRCEERRLCTELRDIRTWGGNLLGPEPEPERARIVLESCAPNDGCDGTGDVAPTAGDVVEGSRSCATQRVCTPVPWPSFADRGREVTAPEPETAAARAPVRGTAPSTGHGCGCRVTARPPNATAWIAFAIALLWRRR